jgi:hypothetical protein
VTRVVCAGHDPLREELARQLDEAAGIEHLGIVDDPGSAPDADVAIVAERDPASAVRLAGAALERGFAVVLVTPGLDWLEDAGLSARAAQGEAALLGFGGDRAFVADLLPAVLALACIRVDSIQVEAADHAAPELGARIRITGEPSFEVEVTGAVTGERALAALAVNAIPLALAASPGLHTLTDVPVVSAGHAGATEPV